MKLIKTLVFVLLFLLSMLVKAETMNERYVWVRVYQGFRSSDSLKGHVSGAYRLLEKGVNWDYSGKSEKKERASLKRIYNLSKLVLVARGSHMIRSYGTDGEFVIRVVDSRDFALNLQAVNKSRDLFALCVTPKSGKPCALLKTTLQIPESRVTAVGFEIPGSGVFYIALSWLSADKLPPPPPPPPKRKDIPRVPSEPDSGLIPPPPPPELSRKVLPEYPEAARSAGIEGSVELEIIIGVLGKVETVRVLSGHPMLARAAKATVRQWKYEQLVVRGKPQPAAIRVTLTFSLDSGREAVRARESGKTGEKNN